MSIMKTQSKFQATHEFALRKEEAVRIRAKYPDKIPVIVERASNSSKIPDIDKHKFLVPLDLTVAQFVYIIRKRIKLTPEQAIFIFVNNQLPPTSMMMSQLYEAHKDPDLFMYILYSGETAYGS
jgi:GABA(A) receptor-associated protein